MGGGKVRGREKGSFFVKGNGFRDIPKKKKITLWGSWKGGGGIIIKT